MRDLSLGEVVELHQSIVDTSGGAAGVRDLGALESALAQPRHTVDGVDLYPTLVEKAAALGYPVVQNHPFLDGNKRIAHAAMETFLILNGFEIDASNDKQEQLMLGLAASRVSRAERSAVTRRRARYHQRRSGAPRCSAAFRVSRSSLPS
jgi:death-on-curing protein